MSEQHHHHSVAAAPGSEHGENPVTFKETKPLRETRTPPPWPTQSTPPSAAPGSHGTP